MFQDFNEIAYIHQSIDILLKVVVSLIFAIGGTIFSEWIGKLLIKRRKKSKIISDNAHC